MKKYQLLKSVYQPEVDSIKNIKKEMEAARKREDFTAWNALNQQFGVETTQLRAEIESEYSGVPFTARAQEGINRFWEVAFG